VELKNEQLSISALVRSPLLALRCQLPDKKVRLQCSHISKQHTHKLYRSGASSSSSGTAMTMTLSTTICTSWD
jgi:hypothetical protein